MTGSHYRLGAPSVSLPWGPPVTFNSILPSFSVSSVSFPITLRSPQGTSLGHKYYACLSLRSLLGSLHCGFSVPGLPSIFPRVPRGISWLSTHLFGLVTGLPKKPSHLSFGFMNSQRWTN